MNESPVPVKPYPAARILRVNGRVRLARSRPVISL
jgi:hypothetical protein